jgi:hypothetical protein
MRGFKRAIEMRRMLSMMKPIALAAHGNPTSRIRRRMTMG